MLKKCFCLRLEQGLTLWVSVEILLKTISVAFFIFVTSRLNNVEEFSISPRTIYSDVYSSGLYYPPVESFHSHHADRNLQSLFIVILVLTIIDLALTSLALLGILKVSEFIVLHLLIKNH